MAIKVWYPGPSVDPSEHQRQQAHPHLGLIVPGWNEAQDDEHTLAAIDAGLVALEAPAAPKLSAPKVAPLKFKDDTAPTGADKE